MKTDAQIRDDVIEELRWDPQIIEPDAIGAAVMDGAVTLTGHVPSFAEKLAAARAAERVYGVKAVANDLKVKPAGSPRDDSDIARAIAHVLEWNVQIPEGQVRARVENGLVTLDGEVEHDYQRREVERMVRQVRGVTGVLDNIKVTPPVSPESVQAEIEEAFKRGAEVDARHIQVDVTDHTARLWGHVHSIKEAAGRAGRGRGRAGYRHRGEPSGDLPITPRSMNPEALSPRGQRGNDARWPRESWPVTTGRGRRPRRAARRPPPGTCPLRRCRMRSRPARR
jgi:osmotically-inducible protein OsmY